MWRKTLNADRGRRLRMMQMLREEMGNFPREYEPTAAELEQVATLEAVLRETLKKWRKPGAGPSPAAGEIAPQE